MNKSIYKAGYIAKDFLASSKFYSKKLSLKRKSNTAEMKTKTDLTYEHAVQTLNEIYPEKKIDFKKPVRSQPTKYDVSIICPIYNAEKHLEECIQSMLNQNTKFSYEIICVNDGSYDNSLSILKKISRNKKIVLINQKNGGLSSARNAGMRIAQGKYFLFVDSDDILPEKSIESLVSSAYKNNADIVLGNIAKCNQDGEVYYINNYKTGDLHGLLECYNCNMIGTAWGRLYKRELWNDIDFFNGYAYEDAIVWCNIYPKCNNISYVSETVYIFRSQNNSLFKSQNNSVKCLDAVWIINGCIKMYDYLQIKETSEWYQMILWQLSVGIVTRIGYLSSDEVLQSAFVVAKKIVENRLFFHKCVFHGKNKKIYAELEESFANSQYKKWIEYSKLLSYSNRI